MFLTLFSIYFYTIYYIYLTILLWFLYNCAYIGTECEDGNKIMPVFELGREAENDQLKIEMSKPWEGTITPSEGGDKGTRAQWERERKED